MKNRGAARTIAAPRRVGDPEDEGAPLAFFSCGCAKPRFRRQRRRLWMRLIPFLRLYRCLVCGRDVLRGRVGLRDVYPLF